MIEATYHIDAHEICPLVTKPLDGPVDLVGGHLITRRNFLTGLSVGTVSAGWFMAALSAMVAAQDRAAWGARVQLHQQTGRNPIDWQALLKENPDTIAWLTVENTGISSPVVLPSEEDGGDFYLTHSFNRKPSLLWSSATMWPKTRKPNLARSMAPIHRACSKQLARPPGVCPPDRAGRFIRSPHCV